MTMNHFQLLQKNSAEHFLPQITQISRIFPILSVSSGCYPWLLPNISFQLAKQAYIVSSALLLVSSPSTENQSINFYAKRIEVTKEETNVFRHHSVFFRFCQKYSERILTKRKKNGILCSIHPSLWLWP